MKSLILSLVIVVSGFAFIGTTDATGQAEQKLSATPRAFQTFYARFKAAVAKRDKNAVAALTAFPFKYGWDAGDEGTYSRSQFIRNYDRMFNGTRRFFAKKNPTLYVQNGRFGLMNDADASNYGFEKRGSTYKFVSFIVLP